MTRQNIDNAANITIARASLADAVELSAFSVKTYTDTFGSEFEPDELAHYLAETVSVPRWEDTWRSISSS